MLANTVISYFIRNYDQHLFIIHWFDIKAHKDIHMKTFNSINFLNEFGVETFNEFILITCKRYWLN